MLLLFAKKYLVNVYSIKLLLLEFRVESNNMLVY